MESKYAIESDSGKILMHDSMTARARPLCLRETDSVSKSLQ